MTEAVQEAIRQTNFSQLDWGIVGLYLMLSVAVGLIANRYTTSMVAYIGAGRSLGTWLGVATMTGTELGLITVMYAAEKGFNGGFATFHIAAIAGAVTLWIGLTGFIVGPLRDRGVLTIPEFYEQRFDRRTRVVGGIILAGAGILNMGLFLKVGSQFIVTITGLPHDGMALPIVMTVLLAIVLVYTVLGGMISVVITDYIQFVVLSFGLLLTTVFAIAHVGWGNAVRVVAEQREIGGFDPFAEGGAFGTEYVLWMILTAGIVGSAVWPTAVARALAMKDSTAVRRQYMWSSVSFTIRFLIPYFWGICAFVFVVDIHPELRELFFQADSLDANKEGMSAIQAMPLLLSRVLPIGVIGLITAAMIAAFMSTHDSYLLCWSSVITQDVIAPLAGDRFTTAQRIWTTRVLIVLIGLAIWGWGLFYDVQDNVWDYMAATGAIYFIGAFTVLVGGLYWSRASSAGALCALLCGCTALFSVGGVRKQLESALVARVPEWQGLDREILTGERVGLAAVAITVVVFVAVSLLFPDRNKQPVVTEAESP